MARLASVRRAVAVGGCGGEQPVAVERHHDRGDRAPGHEPRRPRGRRVQGQGGHRPGCDRREEVVGPADTGEQTGGDRGLDQRDRAKVGAVHLDGGGEVRERGARSACGLGQRHHRQAHGHHGLPEGRIEAGGLGLADPLAVRFLGVQAGGGLPQGVLIGREGEVHEPLLAFLTGRQTVCHHRRRHGRSGSAVPARGRGHRRAGWSGLHGAHRGVRRRRHHQRWPRAARHLGGGRHHGSLAPGGQRLGARRLGRLGPARPAHERRQGRQRRAGRVVGRGLPAPHRRLRPPAAGGAGLPHQGRPARRGHRRHAGSCTSCPRCGRVPDRTTWPPPSSSGRRPWPSAGSRWWGSTTASSPTPRSARSGPPTSPPTPPCSATATRGRPPLASGAPAGARSS